MKRIKVKNLILVLIYFFLVSSFICAQNNMDIQWQSCFGGTGFEQISSIVKTENGYLLFGESNSEDGDISYNHGGDGDIWIVSIDSIGNILWERCYGGSETDIPNNIIKINDDEYYFGAGVWSDDGDVQSGNHGGYDRWVVKINGDGDIIWEHCYGGSMTEYGGSLKLLSDGNILTYAASFSGDGDVPVNYGFLDVWLMIITPDGEILKSEVFGNMWQNNVFDIIETSDGGFFMASKAEIAEGMVQGDFHGETDVWALKLDADLNIQWQKLYGGSNADYGYRGVLELEDGYIFLASTDSFDGDVTGFHGGIDDIWVVRIDLEGNIIWQKCLGGNNSEHAGTLHKSDDGCFFIIGETDSNNGDVSGNHSAQGYSDIWMIKLSESGELIWQKCYGGQMNEKIYKGVIRKNDNNWVLAGRTENNSFDVNCNLHSLEDFWVFEIKDTTTSIFDSPAIQDKIKVYPNPAKDYVVFSTFAKASVDGIEVIIFDVFGKEITRLSVNPLSGYKTVWDTRQVQNGIYFYYLEIEGKRYSGKVVVQK